MDKTEIKGQRNNGEKTMEQRNTELLKIKDKIAIGKPHFSIITLNVNGLNSPIKWHRVADWIKKQNPTIYYLQEIHLSCKDKYRLKVEQ